jgi:isoleucyl-tRNA synthetase
MFPLQTYRQSVQFASQSSRARFYATHQPNPFNRFDKTLSGRAVSQLKEKRDEQVSKHAPAKKGLGTKNEYRDTLNLPSTKFDIRAYAETREVLFRKRTTSDLYKWQDAQSDRASFVLHDGPPYANGSLHIGHTVNKMLKDIIIRYQVLNGKRVHYVPGSDCHGLPIEQKVLNEFPGKSPREVPALDMREACRKRALEAIEEQTEEFKLYGILSDWSKENTYRTLDTSYEIRQLKIFGEMVRKGLIYRAFRPNYWSPSSQTALAEAEIEYEPNYNSRSIYIRFPLVPGPSLLRAAKGDSDAARLLQNVVHERGKINAIIWTTTPWTLPSNMALNVNPELSYSLVQVTSGPCKGENCIVATDLIEKFQNVKLGLSGVGSKLRPKIESVVELLKFSGSDLLDSTYRHPFLSLEAEPRPILAADYVTATTGTGLVHSAPAHGLDDYQVWQRHCRQNPKAAKEELISPIDDRGVYTEALTDILEDAGMLEAYSPGGKTVLGTGGKEIVRILTISRDLMGEQPIQHPYPHDWRTKLPIITRATSQWFANLEPIKEAAIRALDKVNFTPESGRIRLQNLIQDRNEWCISRQRSWGVPIPVLYNSTTGEPLLTTANVQHITEILREKGTNYWWKGNAEEFVAPEEQVEGANWVKGLDTMDVWFDSGTSWSMLPGVTEQGKIDTSSLITSPRTSPANVYLEGSDQHRGWFQSSLLTYIATASPTTNSDYVAPYQNVVTHGFTVDRKGQKMSKSVGNVISPLFFIQGGAKNKEPAFGTDVLRWWVARIDYTKEIIVSPLVIRHASDDLRKVRNTCRFLLANLPLPELIPSIDSVELEPLERYIMHELAEMNKACREAYDSFEFTTISRRMVEFGNNVVSAIYLDVVKEDLYAEAVDSKRRRAILAVLDQILKTFLSVIAPIAPHLAEDIYHYYNGAVRDPISKDEPAESYFTNTWHTVPTVEGGELAAEDMKEIFKFRNHLIRNVEEAREMKRAKSTKEVQLTLAIPSTPQEGGVDEKTAEILRRNIAHLPRILDVAYVDIVEDLPARKKYSEVESSEWHLADFYNEMEYMIESSRDQSCPRCWNSKRKEDEEVCPRCTESLLLLAKEVESPSRPPLQELS